MTSDRRLTNAVKQLKDARMYDYYSYIPLSAENKNKLISHVLAFNSEKHISRFEIFKDNNIIFVAYDGFEIAEIASEIQLSESFIEKYVRTDLCIVLEKVIYPNEQVKYNINPTRIMY